MRFLTAFSLILVLFVSLTIVTAISLILVSAENKKLALIEDEPTDFDEVFQY